MGNKLILVDGHSILFRAFYGLPPRIIGKDGKPIHAVMGFVGTLLKILTTFDPAYLLIVFDSETTSFRNEIDPDYKGHRIRDWSSFPDNENPFTQLPMITHVLNWLGWKHCEVAGFESDDVLAAYARKFQLTHPIIIVSGDSDMLQLVNEQTFIFYPRGKQSILFDAEKVKGKFGVDPAHIPDLKALVGDKSDNIPGIPGIGLKTGQKLISQFGCIEKIYDQISDVTPPSVQLKLIEYRLLVGKNVSLIRLNRDIDLAFELSDLTINGLSTQRKTTDVLKETGFL